MQTNFKIGDMVRINCPVYRNGKRFTGIVTSTHKDAMMVRISGNKKSTLFANRWLALIDLSRIPVSYDKENKAWSEIGYNH